MNEHENKTLESLVKKVMKDSNLESPSLDFTSNIMSQVNEITLSSATVYEPLISKKTWLIIAAVVLAISAYLLFGNTVDGKSWFGAIDFSFLYNNQISELLSGIAFSKTVVYAVALFGLMFFIQVSLLKNHFDKRFEF